MAGSLYDCALLQGGAVVGDAAALQELGRGSSGAMVCETCLLIGGDSARDGH